MLLVTMISCIASAGCLTRTEVLYVRATKLPAETRGFMRMAQETVRVNRVGTDRIGSFTTVQAAGYIIVHEQDVKAFVRSAARLQKILADSELGILVKRKGL